ncbi:MAG: hypothetical protein IKG22_10135 [Atopobiaceae bacterium]|nr:hypothetical protein [Atopobiaceae bacterium]
MGSLCNSSLFDQGGKSAPCFKNGMIQVKKGAKAGTYTIKLKASVAKMKNYKATSTKVVTVKITVR